MGAVAVGRSGAGTVSVGVRDRLTDSPAHVMLGAPSATATGDNESHRVIQADGLSEVTVRVRDGNDLFTLNTRRYRARLVASAGQP